MTENEKFDLAILGSGPGGYVAAIRAVQLGMKAAIIEKENIGGVCLNWGCIPTKALLRSAEVLSLMRRGDEFGLKCDEIEINFPAIIKRSRQVANRVSKGIAFLLKKNNIQVFSGIGRFGPGGDIFVSDRDNEIIAEIKADRYLLATGARPRNLPGLELDGKKVISYREAMTLPESPESIIIIGAGAIGVEFAYFFHSIGAQVTLIEMMPQILPQEDAEIVEVVHRAFKKSGISIAVNTLVETIHKTEGGVRVEGNILGEKKSWEAQICLVAVGVQANSDGIGLEEMGVQTEKGFVLVDDTYRTPASNIWAIGDLIGAPMLAHAASHEGITAIEAMQGIPAHRLNAERIPSCTYCQPQVASIGLTEKQAQDRNIKVRIGRFPFVASGKAVAFGEREGMIKLLFDDQRGNLIGAHIVGAEATELIGELGLAQTFGATPENIAASVHAHPTLSESIAEAALNAIGRAVHI